MFDTLFYASVVVFVSGLIISVFVWLLGPRLRSKNYSGIKPPWIAAIGIFFSVLLYSIIESFGGIIEVREPYTQVLLLTLQTFTFARDALQATEAFASLEIGVDPQFFYGFGNLLYFSASLTTLGTIISLVSKRLVLRTLRFTSMFRETYVFSRATEQAITLAISIREDNLRRRTLKSRINRIINIVMHNSGNHGCSLKSRLDRTTRTPKKCQIIFADANLENDRLLEKIRNEGFKYIDTVTSAVVSRCRCRCKTHLHIILTSNTEVENLHEGIELSKTLNRMLTRSWLIRRLGSQPTLYVFASSSAAESYVDRMVRKATKRVDDKELPPPLRRIAFLRRINSSRMYNPDWRPQIRRIDWTRNVVQQMLVDYPLFLTSALPKNDNDAMSQNAELYTHEKRRIVIVGAGNMGYAFLKAVLWCGQSLEVQTYVDVIDKDAERIELRLKTEAPGLFEATDGSVFFRFLSYDVNTVAYLSYLEDPSHEKKTYCGPANETVLNPSAAHITYMLFALDDDLVNTETAKRTREVLESHRISENTNVRPFIAVVVDDHELANSIIDIENSKSQFYDLVPVGNDEIVFSYNNLFCPALESMGERLNFAYDGGYNGSKSEEKCMELWARAKVSYNNFEYNRRSSRASAAFLKYHLYEYCRMQSPNPRIDVRKWARPQQDADDVNAMRDAEVLGMQDPVFDAILDSYDASVGLAKPDESETLHKLMELEHLRWNAYMRTEGFQRCEQGAYERVLSETGKDQHQLARLHICLAPYSELGGIDRWDVATQNRALIPKAIRSSFDELVHTALDSKAPLNSGVIEAIREAIYDGMSTEEQSFVKIEDAIHWYSKLSNGSDAERKRHSAIADSVVQRIKADAPSDDRRHVLLRGCLTMSTRYAIYASKHKKPFPNNDLVIIQNLRKILRG